MPDVRKSLQQLRKEWRSCTACELGVRRTTVEGEFVFGGGETRGLMFIGEGPGKDEEEQGSPFVGRSGSLLRRVLGKLGATSCYFSNLVCCRSCSTVLDEQGSPRMIRRRGKPSIIMYKDEPPLPAQIDACRPRLLEEIYLVDPVLVVSLGTHATEALLQKGGVSMLKERGTTRHIQVPGAASRAVLTDKKGVWVRKVAGQLVSPVQQNMVDYLLLPTWHPAFVLRKAEDRGHQNPFSQFVADLRLAVKTLERYRQEAFGIFPTGYSDTPEYDIQSEDQGDDDGTENVP